MKRKFLAVAMTLAMTAGILAGCSGGGSKAPETKAPETTTAAAAETTKAAETTAAETKALNKEDVTIGVAMPTKDLQRWNQDGANMKKELENAGYKVDLQYASNDVQTQVSQIENMISNGCNMLVIASIDGSSLGRTALPGKVHGNSGYCL